MIWTFEIGKFCTFHSICHNIGFWQSSFVWKYCAFDSRTFNKKIVLHFFKKDFPFSETCFKVSALKMFKILSDCHINPVGIYLLKVNDRNTRRTCKICSKLTIKTPGIFIVNFEHISQLVLVILLLTLNMQLPHGKICRSLKR